jgi:hypothetical protein
MSMSDDWSSSLNAGSLTGAAFAQPDQGSGGLRSGLASAVTTAGGPNPPLWSPDNPLFWFGGLLLAVGGFIGVSGWVDVGPLKLKGKA